MVSDLMGGLADDAGGFVDDAVGEDLAKADQILSGAEHAPIDIDKVEAEFIKGDDLSTPDGDVPSTAAAPNDAKGKGKPKSSTLGIGKRIEFIHLGYVHKDDARSFHHDDKMDDMADLDLAKVVGSRAIAFRAALEREAVLLAGFARATQAALAEKDQKEGETGDLLTAAADLLGGSGGTAQSASTADLSQFIDKIEQDAWTPINKLEISYADLHTAGIKLHEVRANLRAYVREQLAKQKNAPEPAKGLLSDLPFVGELPIPGVLGDIVGFMQKVTGKLYDVQCALIFDLLLVMQKPIEDACKKATLDGILKKRSPIYPVWFLPPPSDDDGSGQPLADLDANDYLGGDLDKLADEIDLDAVNDPINKAAAKPMEYVDFLSKTVDPAPGSPYLKDIFEAQVVPDGAYYGSAFLGKKAVAAFAKAIGSGEIPGFMTGFVGTVVENVFSICAEFLRSVYEKLCGLKPTEVISSEEMVAAGREHLVFQLVDLILEKSGLTDLLKDLNYPIPQPPVVPTGINWPQGNVSADPIVAELKSILSEKLGPYLDPVMEYVMAGLAERLNSQRAWAGGQAMTMEVHLAQLPSELALMFRGLLGPLWEFLTDTLMGVINNAIGKVLGPLGDAVGLAKDGLGKVTGAIDDAKKKAAQAQAYAKNVEDKAADLMKKASDVKASLSDQSDLANIAQAAKDLKDAVGADPFSDGPGAGPGGGGGPPPPPFPQNRKHEGKGIKIEKADHEKVAEEAKFDDARDPEAEPAEESTDDGAAEEASP